MDSVTQPYVETKTRGERLRSGWGYHGPRVLLLLALLSPTLLLLPALLLLLLSPSLLSDHLSLSLGLLFPRTRTRHPTPPTLRTDGHGFTPQPGTSFYYHRSGVVRVCTLVTVVRQYYSYYRL